MCSITKHWVIFGVTSCPNIISGLPKVLMDVPEHHFVSFKHVNKRLISISAVQSLIILVVVF